MAKLDIYLTFNGNCEEAFLFYQSVFDTKISIINFFKEMPPDLKFPIDEQDLDKVMHVSLPLGDNSVLMGSDTTQQGVGNFVQGNNFSISYNAQSKTQADEIFNKLSEGGKITMPINETFWGSYFGSLSDKFGINWMVNFAKPEEK